MITEAAKADFRRRCMIAQYETLMPGWTEKYGNDISYIEASAGDWYQQRLRQADFVNIVNIAQDALKNCDTLTSVELVRLIVETTIAHDTPPATNKLLADINPLSRLLLTDKMNLDEYKQALQLIIASLSPDEG